MALPLCSWTEMAHVSKKLGLDLAASYMVGHKVSDVAVGNRAGVTSLLVLTGYGLGEWADRHPQWTYTPAHVAGELLDAVQWIPVRSRT